ncbi:MAG: potassium channel family protein, partial [Cyanobium sp. MAG_237]|nr:potassium channel family protein [Cyanobium sp. MAG_237]
NLSAQDLGQSSPVWGLNFVLLNYFAFVSLTTMGYGDVIPESPLAQMVSVAIAIAGTFYVAAVMGVLISRLTVQESQEL